MKILGASSFATYLYGILAVLTLMMASAADAVANPLLGTWQGTSYEQSSGKTWAMTFVLNSDNTYSSLDASTDGKGSYLHTGTYSYTPTTITITVTSGTCTGDSGCNPPVGTIATFPYTISGSGIGSTMVADGNTVTKTSESSSAIPAAERQVLLDLYASTNGASWTDKTGWNGAAGTECTWYGVTCDATLSHITEINLNANNLVGSLPSISGLTHIQVFRVRTNQLTGSLPSLSGLTSLRHFGSRQNQFTGSLPSLSGLTSLQIFTAGDNQLTGSLPSLSGLDALYDLGLENNQLSGPVPALPASFPAYSTSAGYGAYLCGNSLSSSGNTSIDTAWNTATGTDWLACQTSQTYTLSVSRTGTGSGTITSDTGGIDCGTSCWADYTSGTSVALTATPADNNTYFYGWSGACIGTGSCVVTMDAAKNVTAIFKPKPFVATTTSTITPTSATITTTITFNAPDKGKQGSVFITGWAPANGLGSFGIKTAGLSKAMSVTATSDNPYLADKINRRQETLGALLAATDPNTWVLVQKTPSGWQLVQNGQLIPYTTGVLGDSLAAQSILNNTDPTNLPGAQFCVGYGTSDIEMITSGRMLPVAIIPDANGKAATNGSCNVTDVVVEFYNTNLDNYFITADANEAAQIDGGAAGPGWSRTGNTFRSGGKASVCRFYGSYSPGPNSHFYTVDSAECQGLKDQQIPAGDPRKLTDKSWNFESLDFVSTPATNQTCPTGTTPVYRAYNNGFARGVDSNHRITSSLTAISEVVTRGWSNEGVVMCAPN